MKVINNRAKNASRNVVYGVVLKVYQIICPFILRTVMIYVLGMEYVGLNSLFKSILQLLNLSELGVGTALIFNMYAPIAKNDTERVCKLLHLYKLYYRIIGIVIALVGLSITPIVPKLINQNSKVDINIYYIYWISLASTVFSYWLFAYKGSVLQATQRTDIISKVAFFANSCMYALQFSFLYFAHDYYLYLLGLLIGQTINNVVVAVVASRIYPQYRAFGLLDKIEIKRINRSIIDLFTSKVGSVILTSVDSIVISAFLGLNILGRYNNYYYILFIVFEFISILFSSCLAGIGNSIVLETPEKNYNDFKMIAFLIEWLAGFGSCCLLCLYQPFITIWIGESNTLSMGIVVCLAIYLYTITTNQMLCLYKDAAGIWHSDRYRPLVTSISNLIMNLITVQYLGLYGVVLSTVISMLVIGMPWLIHNLFATVFHMKSIEFVKSMILYYGVAFASCGITFLLCYFVPQYDLSHFVIRIVICLVIPNAIYWCIFHNKSEYRCIIRLLRKLFDDKLGSTPLSI